MIFVERLKELDCFSLEKIRLWEDLTVFGYLKGGCKENGVTDYSLCHRGQDMVSNCSNCNFFGY